MKSIEINTQEILDMVEKKPMSKEVLEELFPKVFENEEFENSKFCRIGSIVRRGKYPNSIYAIVKVEGYVKLLNITNSQFWKDDRAIKIHDLKDYHGDYITNREFKSIIGAQRFDDFSVISNDKIPQK